MRDERQRQKSGCLPAIAMVAAMLAFAGFGVWAEAQQGLVMRVEDDTFSVGVTASELGLIPMDAPNGTTQATGEWNVARLNAFFDDGWRTLGKTLTLDAKGYALYGTVVIPRVEGFCLLGAGVGDTRAEVEYTEYGGSCSRLVNIQSANPILIDYAGLGMYVRGVQIQGWWHATNAGTLKSTTSSHARIGILQRCGDGTVGSGKFVSPHLVVCCCEDAIRWGDSALGDNADQWVIGRLYTPDCRVGIHSICRQAIGSIVSHYDGVRCELLHDFELGGGDYTCHQAILQNDATTLLETRAQVFDDGCYYFGRVKVDGTCDDSDVTLWKNNAPEGAEGVSSQFVRFGLLHQAVGATGRMIVELNGYCRFHVDKGEQVGDLEVTCYGGTSGFQNEVKLRDMRCRSGADPNDFVTCAGTTAYANVNLLGNANVGNVPYENQSFYLSRSAGVTTKTAYDPEAP